jgi:hypothetical protein
MTNDDKQGTVPFSPKESALELDEQTLEGITGGGIIDFLKGCIACGAPKTTETPAPEGKVLTIEGSSSKVKSQAEETARRLQSASGIGHTVVQQGRNTYIVKR